MLENKNIFLTQLIHPPYRAWLCIQFSPESVRRRLKGLVFSVASWRTRGLVWPAVVPMGTSASPLHLPVNFFSSPSWFSSRLYHRDSQDPTQSYAHTSIPPRPTSNSRAVAPACSRYLALATRLQQQTSLIRIKLITRPKLAPGSEECPLLKPDATLLHFDRLLDGNVQMAVQPWYT